jgi:heme-degrading monooxygenase HmoA
VAKLYTVGIWRVKAGMEEEFVENWVELARWTHANVPGNKRAWLLRSREQPSRFISFGPWDFVEAVEACRAETGFQTRIERIRNLLESFDPDVYDVAAEIRVDDEGCVLPSKEASRSWRLVRLPRTRNRNHGSK